MAKLGQTKRVVLIGFVLVLILGLFIAYMLFPDPVPPTLSPSRQLVATPAPDQSRTLSVAPEAKPAPSELPAPLKATVPRKIEHLGKVHAPVSVPVVDTRSPVNSELAPVPKQVLVAVPEPMRAIEVKPAEPPATQPVLVTAPTKVLSPHPDVQVALAVKPVEPPVNQPAQVPVDVPETKMDLQVKPVEPPVIQNVQVTVPNKVLPPVTKTSVALAVNPAEPTDKTPEPATEQSILPTQKLLPAESLANPTASDSEKSSARMMIAGTVAAVVFAPIAVPASIIFGFAAGLFTPTASQLGQTKPIPTKQIHGKQPGNTPVNQPENASGY